MNKLLLLSLLTPLLFQSCKKGGEAENGKNGCTYATASNYDATAVVDDGSCIFSGCTDVDASNYSGSALEDDGSCTYAWSKFVGTYNADASSCDYTDSHVNEISKGPSSDQIIISNFDNRGVNMRAVVVGNEFTFSELLDGGGYIGSGYVIGGVVTIDYSACEDYNYPDECDEVNCQLILTKQ